MNDNAIIELKTEMSAMKTEMTFLNKNFAKMERLMEQVVVIIQEQNNNKEKIKNLEILGDNLLLKVQDYELNKDRIFSLEKNIKNLENKIRKLEDWRLTLIASAWVIGAIVSFIINKIF